MNAEMRPSVSSIPIAMMRWLCSNLLVVHRATSPTLGTTNGLQLLSAPTPFNAP